MWTAGSGSSSYRRRNSRQASLREVRMRIDARDSVINATANAAGWNRQASSRAFTTGRNPKARRVAGLESTWVSFPAGANR